MAGRQAGGRGSNHLYCVQQYGAFAFTAADSGSIDLSAMLCYLPVTAGVLGLLVLGDGMVILFRQHRVQAQRRTALLEQYLPLVVYDTLELPKKSVRIP